MTPTEINGIQCACDETFRRFSTWEAHREGCSEYA